MQYKNYRNLLSTLLKDSKQTYFSSYFKDNIKDIKKTWKGIKSIISMKSKNSDIPSSILDNGKYIIKSTTIANIFNDFLHSVAPAVQSKIKFSCKSFSEYLPSKYYDSFIITPTSKAEIDAIISSLNSNKSTGPNSIPLKILKLTQNEISQHLAHIFNLSFMTGVFPDSLKIAKVIPIHKKDSKLIVSNYRPISVLSNLDNLG